MDQNCGMADPAAIIFDSSEIEQVLPRINALLQIRVLLVLGSTFNSSNVNETHQEELEMLIMDLGDRSNNRKDEEEALLLPLGSGALYLAISIIESLL